MTTRCCCRRAHPESELETRCTHRSGGGAPERSTLAGLRKDKELLVVADAKPEYASVAATIAAVDPAQALYYQACPENNRKARAPACISPPSKIIAPFGAQEQHARCVHLGPRLWHDWQCLSHMYVTTVAFTTA